MIGSRHDPSPVICLLSFFLGDFFVFAIDSFSLFLSCIHICIHAYTMNPLPLPRRLCRRQNLSSFQFPSRPLTTSLQPASFRLRQHQQHQQHPTTTNLTTRSFHLPNLASFLPSSNNSNQPGQTLTATRTLPYTPTPLFETISSVESYSQFLPFLSASTVTARDPQTNYPTRAFLTIGYGPVSETFTSEVICDKARWVVEAKSGAKFGTGASEGIFEFLSTKWSLVPLEESRSGEVRTRVDLEIRLAFKNRFHEATFGAVQGQMAGVMIEAFEKRVREVEALRR